MKILKVIKSFFTRVPLNTDIVGHDSESSYTLEIDKVKKPYPIYKAYPDAEYILVGYGRHRLSNGKVKTTMIFQDTSIKKEITLSEDLAKVILYKAN